ncbi:ribose 5-phosphate isomerase A [Tanacetum coccineum]
MNPPTSHNFQTQSKSFSTDMQTTRQAINNTNHPSSALKHLLDLLFLMICPKTPHLHICKPLVKKLTTPITYHHRFNQLFDLLFFMICAKTLRPHLLFKHLLDQMYTITLLPPHPLLVQSLQSQPTVHEPTLHQSSSSNSLLNQDQDLLSEVEINLADQYEHNLLSEDEIIDGNGNILRTQKMTAKQVYKLNGGEKVLVHVNKDYQLIKNSGGLCSRFMTLILKEPNLCPPDAKDWKECKDSCAAMLIAELRRRFSIPQGESVDKVLSTMLSRKRRTVKYRLKMSLYQQAANKLNEANGINGLDAQEKTYTEDELLAALDLLEPPENFLEHQWRVYKSHLRKPIAKKLSLCGKKARNDQVHTHTTGAVSFARTKDIYKVDNKREPNDFESFHLCYKTKDDTYLQEATRDMMVIANREISSKVKELVGPEGIAEDAAVAKLLGRMRGEGLADKNRFLKEKVDNQTKEIHTHKKQLEMCNKELETCKKQLAAHNKKVESYKKQVETQDLDNVASTSAAAGTCDKR